jgi:GMP synthase (glutamine-hydrolysing)
VRALAIVHQADAGPGVFADSLRKAGCGLDSWWPERQRPARDPLSYDAVIVLGGSAHPDQDAVRPWLAQEKTVLTKILGKGIPILGVCLGAQLVTLAAGGEARRASEPEIGFSPVQREPAAADDPVFSELPERFEALQWHSYECVLPAGGVVLASSAVCPQAFRVADAAWGIQFHAEVTLADWESWVRSYRTDPDAVRIGVDPVALRAAGQDGIEEWNELGRGICDRFLAFAAQHGS